MPGGLDYFDPEGFKKAQACPKDRASISKAAHAQKKQAYGIKKYEGEFLIKLKELVIMSC